MGPFQFRNFTLHDLEASPHKAQNRNLTIKNIKHFGLKLDLFFCSIFKIIPLAVDLLAKKKSR